MAKQKQPKSNRDLYQEVTNSIIDALEEGVAPWVKPWSSGGSAFGGLPVNGSTGRPYTGINVLLLWAAQQRGGFASSAWYTFNQAKSLNGSVKKGSKGTMAVFFKPIKKGLKDEAGNPILDPQGNQKEDTIPLIKHFNLFNAEQIEWPEEEAPAETPVDSSEVGYPEAQQVVDDSGAVVYHGGGKACYVPALDVIHMPEKGRFESEEAYYATLLHELAHWTGHSSRLDRLSEGKPSRSDYAYEELIAEISASFLCAHTGVEGDLQHANYIGSWLEKLRGDKKYVFRAASAAQKAADYLLRGAQPEEDEATTDEEVAEA